MEKSDNDLISEYRAGDESALATLVARYLDGVYALARRLTGNTEEASDITQETFVKVWRTLARYRVGENFRAWLFTIARNVAIDHLRKKKVALFLEYDTDEGDNAITDTLTDPENIPDTILIKMEDQAALAQAMSTLAPADREILELHYNDELTFEEIGKVMGRPPNTVKSRHRRALGALRRYFEETLETQGPGAPKKHY